MHKIYIVGVNVVADVYLLKASELREGGCTARLKSAITRRPGVAAAIQPPLSAKPYHRRPTVKFTHVVKIGPKFDAPWMVAIDQFPDDNPPFFVFQQLYEVDARKFVLTRFELSADCKHTGTKTARIVGAEHVEIVSDVLIIRRPACNVPFFLEARPR